MLSNQKKSSHINPRTQADSATLLKWKVLCIFWSKVFPLHTYLQYLLNYLCQLVARLNLRLIKTEICVQEHQKCSSSMWEFYLSGNTGLEKYIRHWIQSLSTTGNSTEFQTERAPSETSIVFAFNPCFQKLAHSLLALQGFGRLEKIPCNSPLMGDRQGTQHFSSPDSSPSVLTDAENTPEL